MRRCIKGRDPNQIQVVVYGVAIEFKLGQVLLLWTRLTGRSVCLVKARSFHAPIAIWKIPTNRIPQLGILRDTSEDLFENR